MLDVSKWAEGAIWDFSKGDSGSIVFELSAEKAHVSSSKLKNSHKKWFYGKVSLTQRKNVDLQKSYVVFFDYGRLFRR